VPTRILELGILCQKPGANVKSSKTIHHGFHALRKRYHPPSIRYKRMRSACSSYLSSLIAASGRPTREFDLPSPNPSHSTGKHNSLSHDSPEQFISERLEPRRILTLSRSSRWPSGCYLQRLDCCRKQEPSRLRASVVTHYHQCGTDPWVDALGHVPCVISLL
jgi:hypothetical protein